MTETSAPRNRSAGTLSLTAMTYVFAVVMMGTTLPTPLYPTYEQHDGFGGTTTTLLFAVYAAGVILALVLGGRLSDGIGRRPTLLIGIVLSFASAMVFLFAQGEGILFVGRVLSGLSAGIFTSTGTVAVLENASDRQRGLASALATSANIGGLGLGPLIAGAVASATGDALRAPFIVHAALLVIAGIAMLAVREGVTERSRVRLQWPGVPSEARTIFGASVIGAATGFAVTGLFSAVAPNFMGSVLGISSPALVGLIVFLLFAASAAAQVGLRSLPDRALIVLGTIALAVGMLVLVGSLTLRSTTLLVVASILAGVGQGLLFMTGMRAVTAATDPSRRTEATTSYFIVAYLSISIPAIGAGFLSAAIGLVPSAVAFSIAVAVVALAGLSMARRFAGRSGGSAAA